MKGKIVPKLRQEVKVKVDIVTSDDIKIYYTGKFQDFTARYIIKYFISFFHFKGQTFILLFRKKKIYSYKMVIIIIIVI